MKKVVDEYEAEKMFLLSEYGKKKLLTYAESFRELAKSFDKDFEWKETDKDRSGTLYQRKLWENRCLLAENLSEMAQIMSQVAGEVFNYRMMEEKVSRKIIQALKAERVEVHDIYYIVREDGKKSIGIAIRTDRQGGYRTEDIADILSVLLDMRVEAAVTSPYFVDKDFRYYTFVEEPPFSFLTGTARAIKETETISGDNYSIVESEQGKVTILLSDGMGSGEKACEDSEMVLDLMEKFLDAGYSYSTALNLVNGSLVARGEEQNMSTLDICELNLYKGTCEFCKIGAASSFLKRAHMVEQISARTLPLGIFRGVDAEITRRKMMDGDYIIMMSDGVVDAMEEHGYGEDLCQVISNIDLRNPKEIAQMLLQYIIRRSKGNIRDDMSIIVIGVWENS
ncbi:MAG: SpoIIE family protein phosphatase [Lachnospiraceae bacterium]|nr:SpoIIE family protein phosphatase [Lachnospiraceae bacterium]